MDQRSHFLFPRILTGLAIALLAGACGSDSDAVATPASSSVTTEATSVTTADSSATTAAIDETSTTQEQGASVWEEAFPDVVDATATLEADGRWVVAATLSSPYDSPERYADAWRVVGPDGTEYGIRELGHDHANEQPFTRSQSGIEIPEEVAIVTIEGRDQISGWGGATFELELSR